MTLLRSSVLALSAGPALALTASLLLVACGDSTTPPATDSGTRLDGNVTSDLGADDASTDTDAQVADGAVTDAAPTDMCPPLLCPAAPPGCRIEPPAAPCTCGEVKCEDGGSGGMLGGTCGGRAGGCGPGLFCDFGAAFDCGFADGMGTCAARPEICADIFMPVCGCDGMNYSNTCDAQSNGTDVQADGECATEPPPPPPPPPGSDCRTAGCRCTATCEECRGAGGRVFVCIPAGTAC